MAAPILAKDLGSASFKGTAATSVTSGATTGGASISAANGLNSHLVCVTAKLSSLTGFAPTLTDSAGNTYALIDTRSSATPLMVQCWFYKAGANFWNAGKTFTFGSGSAATVSAAVWHAFEIFTGMNELVSMAGGSSGSSAAPTASTGTLTSGDYLLFAAHGMNGNSGNTDTISSAGYTSAPTGTTVEGTTGASGPTNVAQKVGYKTITATSGAQAYAGTLGASLQWISSALVFLLPVDAATASLSLTPSGAEGLETTDVATDRLTFTASAQEGKEYQDSVGVGLVNLAAAAESVHYQDDSAVGTVFLAASSEVASFHDDANVALLSTVSSAQSAHFQDDAAIAVVTTVSSAESIHFQDDAGVSLVLFAAAAQSVHFQDDTGVGLMLMGVAAEEAVFWDDGFEQLFITVITTEEEYVAFADGLSEDVDLIHTFGGGGPSTPSSGSLYQDLILDDGAIHHWRLNESIYVFDDFNRSTGLGSNWSSSPPYGDSANPHIIVSNEAKVNGAYSAGRWINTVSMANGLRVGMTVKTPSSAGGYYPFMLQTVGSGFNGYQLSALTSGTNHTLAIARFTSGAETVMASSNIGRQLVSGDVVELRWWPSGLLQALLNGVVITSVTNTTYFQAGQAAYVGAGIVDGGVKTWDDFHAAPLVADDVIGSADGAYETVKGIWPSSTTSAIIPDASTDHGQLAVTGNGDRITTPLTTNWTGTGGAFSMEGWYKRPAAGAVNDIALMGHWESGNNGPMVWLFDNSDGFGIQYILTNNGGGLGGGSYIFSHVSPTNGAYDHVVATYDGTDQKLYVNGVLKGTYAGTPTTIGAAYPFGIGFYGGGSSLGGSLDEVAVYDFALTAAEVTNHYQMGAGLAPTDAAVVPLTLTPSAVDAYVIGFPTTSVLDDFNRANVSPLDNGWLSPIWLTDGSYQIVSNKASTVTSGTWKDNYWPVSATADCEAYATWSGGDTLELLVRVQNPNTSSLNNYYVSIDFGNTWGIWRTNNHVNTRMGSNFNQTVSVGDQVGIKVIGNDILAMYKPSGGNWTVLATQTVTTGIVSGPGYIGFSSKNSIIDDFGGGPLVSVGTAYTDSGTAPLVFTASSSEVGAFVEASTKTLVLSPLTAEVLVSTDAQTSTINLVASGSDLEVAIDAQTARISLTASATEEISGVSVDANTAFVAFTPSGTEFVPTQNTDIGTYELHLEGSAVEIRAFEEYAQIDVLFGVISEDTRGYADIVEALLRFYAVGDELAQITETGLARLIFRIHAVEQFTPSILPYALEVTQMYRQYRVSAVSQHYEQAVPYRRYWWKGRG